MNIHDSVAVTNNNKFIIDFTEPSIPIYNIYIDYKIFEKKSKSKYLQSLY